MFRDNKKIITFFLIIFLSLFVFLFFYFFLKKEKKLDSIYLPFFQKEEFKKQSLESNENTEEAGKIYLSDYEKSKKARKKNDIQYCYKLVAKSADVCIYETALYNNREELCFKIEDSILKGNCQDNIKLIKIITNNEASQCETLKNSSLQDLCYKNFFYQWRDKKKCNNLSVNRRNQCLEIVQKAEEYNKNLMAICSQAEGDSLRVECQNQLRDSDNDGLYDIEEVSYGLNIFSSDSDEDGLSDKEELKKYHSNPRNPDTDGDGYKDGEEVVAGFNPVGGGKLNNF